MQFPIWHWVILLLLIGVPVFFAVRSAAKPSQNRADLVGFGGWLLLLAIGQTLSPFRTLAELFSSSQGYQQLLTQPNGPLAVCGEIVLLLAFAALQVIVLAAMLRRSPRFKQWFLYQWIAIPFVFALDAFWTSTILGAPISQILTREALATSIAGFVLTGIWVAYVYKSVRVRNTFGRAAAGEVAAA
ncbi:DUF2569 family protein [Mesorhizobium sp.]|uniref:DUF2569 family protein n=1 Tax=Mesorhizobium sp. TaxID=1871066 RepID=UPI000FE40AEF|nr:DUF2569 family protein [Mesorhizobium sp.]RWA76748.1 MAG: DUF2569 family protein [Mesorhizobium sp.]RWC04992.1 MAG: DUF2569 family protein [Mesorhizobium sp.]RWG78876.1 MAG: DUF2569 family protein [Mesorhizobium sp.]RWG82612.1 MAG: DUF2569 family protein [Mesorhizobium sp.]RWK06218.1 MAG: DUF2569 family protein [Mesorhizobium sp.]